MSNVMSTGAATWLSEHHNVATTSDLRGLGLGRKAVERLISLGVLQRLARGVFAATTARPSLEYRCRLLCCLYPGGFVTGPTAGMLGGLRRQPPSAPLHYSLCHGMHPQPMKGVRFRQTTKLVAADRHVRRDGIVVASWRRLSFDLAADLSPLDHRSVIHQLLDRRLVGSEELLAIEHRLGHPARRGTTTFRLSLMELGPGIADSHPEVRLADALLRRSVPVEPQLDVDIESGPTLHLDLGVRAARWGVELDIHPEHRSLEGHRRDSRRMRSLHSWAWQIEPVSELDMVDVERLADELAALYVERATAIGVSGAPYAGAAYSGALQYSDG
jgi:hypothetical protein